jgi:hypothetical protein
MGMPAQACADGSTGGNTGRCVVQADGKCGWEVRECPQTVGCVRSGCGNSLCVEAGKEVITTCEYRPEHACYEPAKCERQADGVCAFTKSPELEACLAKAAGGLPGGVVPVPSSWKLGGVSVSAVEPATIEAELKKLGYALAGRADRKVCDGEHLTVPLGKGGKPVGAVTIIRPTTKPDDCAKSAKPFVVSAYETWKPQAEGPNAVAAMIFDEAGSVLVVVSLPKDPGGSRKLLDKLVTK